MGVWLASIVFLSCVLLLVSIVSTIPSVEALCTFTYGIGGLHVMAEDENLYVMWPYNTERHTGDGDYYLQFIKSNDGGKTFGNIITLLRTHPDCYMHFRTSADKDNIYIMWQDDDGSIMFRGSNDAGETFGRPHLLGEGYLGDSISAFIDGGRILASGDRVYTVWSDGSGNIIFRKSDDSGKNFSEPITLNTEFESYEPRTSSSGNNVYVVWTENYYCLSICETELLFVQSDDYGETFSKPKTLEDLTGNSLSMPAYPIIKSHKNDVYILWKEDFWNFYFSASHDGGKTFSEKMQVTDFREGEFGYTTLFSSFEDAIYIGWQSREGRNAIMKSTDRGQSFVMADLTIPDSFAPPPGIVSMEEAGRAYFLWPSHLSRDNTTMSFASVREGIEGQPEPVNVIEYSESKPYGGMMIASGDFVHILWTNSTGPQSNYEQHLYVMTSTDAGGSFGDSVEIAGITTIPEFSYHIILVIASVIGSIIVISRTGLLSRFYDTAR
jgi:hypothetical protein